MPFLTHLAPISVDDMLLEWALAEPNEWGVGCPEMLAQKVARSEVLMPGEAAKAVEWLLRGRRGRETEVLRKLTAQWYEADLPVASLGDAVPHRHWAINRWAPLHPSILRPRTVAQLAEHSHLPEGFRRGAPDPTAIRRPILIETGCDGPWRVAEGNHRAVAVWHAHREGDSRWQGTLRVILGVHPQMNEWPDYVW